MEIDDDNDKDDKDEKDHTYNTQTHDDHHRSPSLVRSSMKEEKEMIGSATKDASIPI